jgi:predicted nucleic acid-binding protein
MNAERCFVDSNVLIYAYDNQAGEKQHQAQERLTALWSTGNGVLSVQVLQEFFNNATRKLVDPIGIAKAREIVKLYREWVVAPTTPEHVLNAADIMVAHRISFWDSLILAAAEAANAAVLLSEDLSHGQVIAGVRVENPFRNSF